MNYDEKSTVYVLTGKHISNVTISESNPTILIAVH